MLADACLWQMVDVNRAFKWLSSSTSFRCNRWNADYKESSLREG